MTAIRRGMQSGLVLLVLVCGCSNQPDLDEAAMQLIDARKAIAIDKW